MPRFRMYIDDTGNVHNNTSEHPQNRYAAIVGVIMDLSYVQRTFDSSFDLLKRRHFGETANGGSHILHLRKMKVAEGPFAILSDANVRTTWQEACYDMYFRASYTTIVVCVDKFSFRQRYPDWNGSFYGMLVGNAIERYFYYLKSQDGIGDVVSEATNSNLDGVLKDLYRNFWENGTDHIRSHLLRPRLSSREIKIESKSSNVAGVQMADLLASTCFAHCKRIYAQGPDYDPFAMRVADLLERVKFYRDRNGNPQGYGRMWRP